MSGILAYIDYSHTSTSGTQISGQVFISLKDPDTGQPVNGNNIVVTYTRVIVGVVSTSFQVTIAGQGISIYTGVIQDSSTNFFTSFYITAQSDVPDPAPPVNQCDLVIINIQIIQNDSFTGANDGSIKINATSSYAPIEYSLDNLTFQTNPVFEGLSGGNQNVYVRDSNTIGCLEQSSIFIPVNSNLLTGNPGVALAGGNTSRWNAAFNPIVFQFSRRDFEVTGVIASTFNGNAVMLVNADLSKVLANDYVYLNVGPYVGVYKVTIVPSPGQLLIEAFYQGDGNGYVNINRLRPYYKIYAKLTYNDPLTGQPQILLSKNSPDASGLVKADYSNFLQSLLQAKDQSGYNLVNYRDDNLSASYRLSYAEHWEDGTVHGDGTTGFTSNFIQVDETYYVTYKAAQLQTRYAGNMAEYVPFRNLPAKWITDFKEPVYSKGFPFDLSFIYGEDLAGLQLYYKITLFDINRNVIEGGNTITAFLLNEDGSFLLNEDGSKFIIAQQVYYNVEIVEHVGLNRLLIDNDFDSKVYYFSIGIYYDSEVNSDSFPYSFPQTFDNTTAVQVLSDQMVRVDRNCDYNSVYLRWIGTTGSWNYYRFIYNQEVSLDVQNAVVLSRYVDDWENGDTIEDVVSKSGSRKMQVHAEAMSVDEINAVSSIKTSPKVQMCVANSPAKWKTILVNTATYSEYETNLGEYPFAMTFNLPGLNLQTQ